MHRRYSYRVEADAEKKSSEQHLGQVQRVVGVGAARGGKPSSAGGSCQWGSQGCDLPEVTVAKQRSNVALILKAAEDHIQLQTL